MKKGELSNASNSLGHGDNKDESFDDEEHCKALDGVSIKSSERQSQNKNHRLQSIA